MDRKTFSFKITNLDFAGRTVEGYANVFGVKDSVGDIVHHGAFGKTLVERGGKIKFLWQHELGEPIGRILEMNEDDHGLFMKAIISDTARGRDSLALLRDGAVDSFSIGYDSMKGGTDYSKDPVSGETVRNLREIRLYEVSLVTLPANEMATVTALKQKPSEAKPYGVFIDGEQHCIYKVDEDGERTGESLGCHATEDEAMAQMRALYANEKDVEPPEGEGKEMTPHGPIRRLGDVLQGTLHQAFTMLCDNWYLQGMLSRDERIQLSSLIGDALEVLSQGIPANIADLSLDRYMGDMGYMLMGLPVDLEDKSGRRVRRDKVELLRQLSEITRELMTWADYDDGEQQDEEDEDTPEGKNKQQAGPGDGILIPQPPTSQDDLQRLIEIEMAELDLYVR